MRQRRRSRFQRIDHGRRARVAARRDKRPRDRMGAMVKAGRRAPAARSRVAARDLHAPGCRDRQFRIGAAAPLHDQATNTTLPGQGLHRSIFLAVFGSLGLECRDARKRRNRSRIIALTVDCVLSFVPCTIHGILGRILAAGAEVALVAERIKSTTVAQSYDAALPATFKLDCKAGCAGSGDAAQISCVEYPGSVDA